MFLIIFSTDAIIWLVLLGLTTGSTFSGHSKGYTDVPSIIPHGSKVVNLYRNQIAHLPSGVFSLLTMCTTLSLSYNQISQIEIGAFIGLINLQTLSLNHNMLTHLQAGMFSSLTQCTALYLYNNQISEIDPDAFTGLLSLQKLHIYNNQLTQLMSGTFDQTQLLEELYLYGNQMKTLNSSLFIDVVRPFKLQLSFSTRDVDNIWECQTLCWLRLEETGQTISQPYAPKCTEGVWTQVSCPEQGKTCSHLFCLVVCLNYNIFFLQRQY